MVATMNRRHVLSGLIAGPAVIRVATLMRISPVPIASIGRLQLLLDLVEVKPAWAARGLPLIVPASYM
jgi:hypothetical protein